MGAKTMWLECRLGKSGNPCFFPGHNLHQAMERQDKFLDEYSLRETDTASEEYHGPDEISVRCRLKENGTPVFFPGRTFEEAKRKAIRFLLEYGLLGKDVGFEKRRPRKLTITPRRVKKALAKQILLRA